jgi:hypothetical protein
MPSGLKNSSRRISPGGVGARCFGITLVLLVCCACALVVVLAEDLVGDAILRSEGDAILVVDPDAVPTRASTFERFETIAWGHPKISECGGGIQHVELPSDDRPDGSWELPRRATLPSMKQILTRRVPERVNHARMLHG